MVLIDTLTLVEEKGPGRRKREERDERREEGGKGEPECECRWGRAK